MYWFKYVHDTVCTRVFDWQILDTKQLKVFTYMQDFRVKRRNETAILNFLYLERQRIFSNFML